MALFTGAYMLAFGVYSLASGNREFVFYSFFMVLTIAGLVLLDRRVRLPVAVLWGLSVWGLLHMAGGNVPIPDALLASAPKAAGADHNVLYNFRPAPWFPKFDQLVHAFGFFMGTLTCWHALLAHARSTGGTIRPRFGPVLAVVLAGMGLGAINEVIEFAATKLIPGTNVGGYENTGWDLVSNLAGCVLASVVIRSRVPSPVPPAPGTTPGP